MEVLVRVDPETRRVSALDGASAWAQDWPDANKYQLQYSRLCTDARFTTPLEGYCTEIWHVSGEDVQVSQFLKEKGVTALTKEDAEGLAAELIPPASNPCFQCGGSGVIISETPTMPALDSTVITP